MISIDWASDYLSGIEKNTEHTLEQLCSCQRPAGAAASSTPCNVIARADCPQLIEINMIESSMKPVKSWADTKSEIETARLFRICSFNDDEYSAQEGPPRHQFKVTWLDNQLL
jgi:hypothetical protein